MCTIIMYDSANIHYIEGRENGEIECEKSEMDGDYSGIDFDHVNQRQYMVLDPS